MPALSMRLFVLGLPGLKAAPALSVKYDVRLSSTIATSRTVKMLSSIFEQFVEESPVSVMARGLMERVFAPKRMARLFETHAQQQYQQELLFST